MRYSVEEIKGTAYILFSGFLLRCKDEGGFLFDQFIVPACIVLCFDLPYMKFLPVSLHCEIPPPSTISQMKPNILEPPSLKTDSAQEAISPRDLQYTPIPWLLR